ncbi:MAG: carboxypeptidase regulatory-like domain-containing protein [Kofleriaceae bacterium]|nr:carboxypeptidase regulatory-like domain-containing protein [Kofleriaceae bacterium]
MRRKLAVFVGLVVVVLLLWWWKGRGGDTHEGGRARDTAAAGSKLTEGGAAAQRARERAKLGPAKLAGRVTRKADGSPVAGATVAIAAGDPVPKFLMAKESPTLVTTTDANGAWKVERVTPGAYRIAATAKGLLPGQLPKLVVAAGEDRRDLDLALVAGGALVSGTVTDVGGGPIADARVTAVRSGIRELQAPADFVAVTGPDGRYELTLPPGELRLTASHDDYADGSQGIELGKEPMTVDFSLVPGATIRGQVVARDSGKPVSGGLIRAEGNGRGLGGGDGFASVDEQGAFVLRGLSSGELELSALGPGYASETPTIVTIGIGEQLDDVKVLVDHAYSISGRVVRKGKPDDGLTGIVLGAFSIASQAFGFSIDPSDSDGAYKIVGLKKGSYNMFAFGEGSVPDVGTPVEIVDRDLDNVIVELDAGVTISGRVEPAAQDVSMSLEPTGPIGFANMFEAAKAIVVHADTDATGAFVLHNVPAGSFTLHANSEDGRKGSQLLVVAQIDQSGVVVKLEQRASVSGRVVDTSGKPAAGVRVVAQATKKDDGPTFSFNGRRDGVTTRNDGSFTIVGLEAGEYTVSAQDGDAFRDRGTADKDKTSKAIQTVTLAATEAKTGITLTVEARDGVIRGSVIAPDGKPAADAWVTASLEVKPLDGVPARFARFGGDRSEPVLTNADGQFVITRLRKGSFTVEVEGPKGTSRAEKPGVKPGDSVTIKLVSFASLNGKVTVGGQPVTKYTIACNGPKDAKKHVEAADGTYTLERLAAGSYECDVDSDAGEGSAKIDVGSEPEQLDIALKRWATVTGVAVDVLTKKPVPGLIVMAGSEDGRGGQAAFANIMTGRAPTTDPNGRFTVDRIPAGTGTVSLMPKDGFTPLGTRPYTATEGGRIDLGTIEVVAPRTGDAGTFGMATEVEGDKLVVSSVTDGGPAKAAGVQVGDRIMALDGREVASLTPGIAKLLLSSGTVGVGQTVALTLERAGTPVQVSVTSVKW